MLCREYPDMDDDQRKELALQGASRALKLAQYEQATGQQAVLVCRCKHPDKAYDGDPGHLFGSGKCKTAGCDCPEFQAESSKLE
jgi:hypothetical protein